MVFSDLRRGGGSPLEDGQWVAMLDPEWGPLFGIEVTPCLFGREFLWLGKRKVLVWEVIREGYR